MLEIDIPGRGEFHFNHLVSDVNGTLAVDGTLIDGLASRLARVGSVLTLHLLTADTHGKQDIIDQQLGLRSIRIQPGDEARQKADYVRQLGAETVIALGQGANDAEMLKAAGLGLCVLSVEGTAIEAMQSADILVPDIFRAMDLIEKPLRILADLRR